MIEVRYQGARILIPEKHTEKLLEYMDKHFGYSEKKVEADIRFAKMMEKRK